MREAENPPARHNKSLNIQLVFSYYPDTLKKQVYSIQFIEKTKLFKKIDNNYYFYFTNLFIKICSKKK